MIRVCKKKFENRLTIVGIVLWHITILGATAIPICLVVSLILNQNPNDPTNIILVLATMFSSIPHIFGLMTGTHWIQYLVKHQKIFGWNKGC